MREIRRIIARGVAGIEMSRHGGRVIIGYVNRENATTLNKKVLLSRRGWVEGEDEGNPATWRKREERIGTTGAFLRDLL